MINSKIKNRINNLYKQKTSKKTPNLVMIIKEKLNWKITEHYYKPNYKVSFKTYYYDNYKDYLDKVVLDKNTPVIVNNLPREEG